MKEEINDGIETARRIEVVLAIIVIIIVMVIVIIL